MMKESSTNLILSEAVVPCYVLRRVPTGPGGVALGAEGGSDSVLTLSLCVWGVCVGGWVWGGVCVCVCVCLCVCVVGVCVCVCMCECVCFRNFICERHHLDFYVY